MTDSLNVVSKLSGKKVLNALQILSSYDYSKANSKAVMGGLPSSMSIEPTTSCNLRCLECPSGLRDFTRPTGMLDTGLFKNIKNIIDQVQLMRSNSKQLKFMITKMVHH